MVDGTNKPFTDVKPADYFANPVQWALENGITAGVSADKFGPHNPCTRGQIVSFLYRAAGSPDIGKVDNPFKDVKESDYFYKAVLWAVENNITAGMSKDSFAPNSKCTRGQIVCFLERYYNVKDDNPIVIVSQPKDYQMLSSSEDASFTVEILGGTAKYYYEWYVVYDNETRSELHGPTSAKSDVFTWQFTDYDFDDYRDIAVYCEVSDIEGRVVTTQMAKVLHKGNYTPFTIVTQPAPYVMSAYSEEISFDVKLIDGVAPYTYKWYVARYSENDLEEVIEFNETTDDPTSTFTATFSDDDFEGLDEIRVYCEISDAAGTKDTSDEVNLYSRLIVSAAPQDHQMHYSSETAEFAIRVKGGSGKYIYEWYVNGEMKAQSDPTSNTKNSFSYDFTDYDFDDARDYYIEVECIVTDADDPEVSVSRIAKVLPKELA